MSAEPIHLTNATPFDLITESIEDLFTEARNWADGTAIDTQAQADDVSRLIDELNQNASALEAERVTEKKPLDDKIQAIQDRYNGWIADRKNKKPGKVWGVVDALKATLAVYLRKLDDDKRKIEEDARAEAEAKSLEAAEALRAADPTDLASREEADEKVHTAEVAQKAAKIAANDKATANGGSRAISLRTKRTAKLTNARVAAAFFWKRDANAFDALLQKLADDMVRAGQWSQLEGNGFDVTEERVL